MIPLRDANPTRRRPVLTIALIVACVTVFAWELGLLARGDGLALDAFIRRHGAVPADVTASIGAGRLLDPATVGVITGLFLHGSWLHLLGNMLYLWIFGNNVEDRFGPGGFALFYLLGGIVAAAAQIAVAPGSTAPMIGASGAIAATLGAYLVLWPRARITSLVVLGFLCQLVAVPAVVVLGFWFVLQLFDGVASLGVQAQGGVAFFAHVGGFIAGVVVAGLLRATGGVRTARTARVG